MMTMNSRSTYGCNELLSCGIQKLTLENALTSKGISKEFKEWIAIANDRPK